MTLTTFFRPMLAHMPQRRRAADALPQGSILFDHFNGANDATLAARVPPVHPNANTWGVPGGTFVTNLSKAEARFSAATPALLRVDMGIADLDVSVTFVLPSTGTNRSAGILFRYTNTSNFWYTLANADTAKYRIFEFTSASATQRAEADFAFQANVPYTMRLVLVGDHIFSTIEGIGTLTYDSAVRNTATFHGLRATNSAGGGAVTFENINVLPPPPAADAYVTIASTPTLTSDYNASITHVAVADLRGGHPTAVERAKVSLATGLHFHRLSVMSYGANDPWEWDGTGTRPAEPWNWSNLDANLQMVLDMAGTPILGFAQWPWHIRGIWDGTTTTPCTVADRLGEHGRPLTNSITDLRHFVRRVAERYLPQGVRYWQLTNWEAHGFERDRAGGFTDQGFDDYAGTAGHADMGMAYLHNQVYAELLAVATELGINRNQLHIITGYFRIGTNGVPNAQSVAVAHPLRELVWGTANKSGINAVLGHLPLLTADSFDYWSYDIGSLNQDSEVLTDDWTNLQKFTDCGQHIKDEVAAIGFGSKGCFVSERYTKPQTDPGTGQQQLRAAINAEAERRFLLLGVDGALYWSPIGRANEPGAEEEAGLITSTAASSGGQTQPAFDALKLYHDHFPPGTAVYALTFVGSGVSGIASDDVVLLINQTNAALDVGIDTAVHSVGAYGVVKVDR